MIDVDILHEKARRDKDLYETHLMIESTAKMLGVTPLDEMKGWVKMSKFEWELILDWFKHSRHERAEIEEDELLVTKISEHIKTLT